MAPIPPHVAAILDKNVTVHLATINGDGSPQVTPIWIERDGDVLRFGTAEGRVKVRNLRRDPRLTISLVDPDDPETWAVIHGRATSIDRRGWALIDRLAGRYRGTEGLERVAGAVRLDVEVEVDRVIG